MSDHVRLTPRQQSVVIGLSQGWDIRRVAKAIQASRMTVYRDLQAIAAKMGYKSSPTVTGLVVRAREQELISPNLRLTKDGQIVMTVKAAARGERN